MFPRFSAILIVLLLTGCSMPRIIVLNDPLNAKQHNDLGATYESRKEYDLAIREYKRAAELDDAWALPRFNLGNVHAIQGQWSQAIAAYRKAKEIDPELTDAENNLAWALVENDELEEGVVLAEQVVARNPGNPAYWDTLATAYLAANRPQDADRAAREGLKQDPPPGLEQALQKKLIHHSE